MTTLTSEMIAISALEEAGKVEHIDLDRAQIMALMQSPYEEVVIDYDLYQSLNPGFTRPKIGYVVGRKGSGKTLLRAAPTPDVKVNLFRLYSAKDNSELTKSIVNTVNISILHEFSAVQNTVETLLDLAPFASRSETEMVLLHRFAKWRSDFFGRYTMLSREQALEWLGMTQINARRTINNLTANHKLIVLKHKNKTLVPEFQFNRKGEVYAALVQQLPRVSERGIDLMDLCRWLTTNTDRVISAPTQHGSLKGVSLEEAIQQAQQVDDNTQIFSGKPIDTLASSNNAVFNALVKQWLEPDSYDISQEARQHG